MDLELERLANNLRIVIKSLDWTPREEGPRQPWEISSKRDRRQGPDLLMLLLQTTEALQQRAYVKDSDKPLGVLIREFGVAGTQVEKAIPEDFPPAFGLELSLINNAIMGFALNVREYLDPIVRIEHGDSD